MKPLVASRASVAFVLFTAFIDSVGLGLAFPVVPKLVQQLVGGDAADGSFVYGLLVSSYALMQLIFAPILGALSDRFGRRPVLLIAMAGLAFDYVLLSLAPTMWWLVAGRVISGILGSTYVPAGAYMADVTPPEKRAASFGLFGVAFGLGFIGGPAIGGALGEVGLRVPFMVGAGLAFANLLFGLIVMPESLKPENRRPIDAAQLNPIGALRAIWRYDAVARLTPILLAAMVAQQGLVSVWVPYTTYRFGWSVSDVGVSLAIVGLLSAVVQGGLVRPIVAHFGEQRTLVIALSVIVVAQLLFGLATEGRMMYATTALYCLGLGLNGPAIQGLMSRAVPADQQGLLQGALTTMVTGCAIVAPLLANGMFAAAISTDSALGVPGIPFFFGSAICLVALALAVRRVSMRAPAIALEVGS